jgi:hypothetical protein
LPDEHLDLSAIEDDLRSRDACGQIEEASGLLRFLLRGLENGRAEWALLCATHDLLELFRHRSALP